MRRPAAVPCDRRAGVCAITTRPINRSTTGTRGLHSTRNSTARSVSGSIASRPAPIGKALTRHRSPRWKPQRTWTQEYQPLAQNNRGGKSWPVDVENPGPGYYLLTAEARYCPVLAGCKFCLSNVTVYLRAGPNRVAAVAVDRQTGKPVAGLPMELHVSGRPDERLLVERSRPARREGFLARLPRHEGRNALRPGADSQRERNGKPAASRPADNERDPLVDGTAAGKEEAFASDDPFAESSSQDRLGGQSDSADVRAVDQVLAPLPQTVVAAESYVQGAAARRSWPEPAARHRPADRKRRPGRDGSEPWPARVPITNSISAAPPPPISASGPTSRFPIDNPSRTRVPGEGLSGSISPSIARATRSGSPDLCGRSTTRTWAITMSAGQRRRGRSRCWSAIGISASSGRARARFPRQARSREFPPAARCRQWPLPFHRRWLLDLAESAAGDRRVSPQHVCCPVRRS